MSGACGLLYQVVWTRKLVLFFGTTSFAVSTVLSIFFLGLGLGSLWGGRLADRSNRPLFIYGLLEIIVGLWAILFIVFIDAGESVLVDLLRWVGPRRVLGIAMRAVLAAGFLIVPVTLMGATLPLLAKFVSTEGALRGFRIGVLYSLNTFGAVLGCGLTGFVLLAQLGYTQTTLWGAAANIEVGILALVVHAVTVKGGTSDSRKASPPQREKATAAQREEATAAHTPAAILVMVAFAVSGFCSLALEVLWTRLLSLIFLGTTYAFTTMLTTMLCGIALGSAVASAWADRLRHRAAAFGAVQFLTGLACLLMLFVFPSLPGRLKEAGLHTGYGWNDLVFSKFVLSFLVLFLPTFLFGMSFPLAVRAVSVSVSKVGRDVGRLYSANTFGGVAGALVGGFLLIPLVGAHRGILYLALMLCAMGMALTLSCPTLPKLTKRWFSALAIAALAVTLVFLPGDVSRSLSQWFIPEDHRAIHYSEGIEGTVVVSEPVDEMGASNRFLWINAVQATASIEKGVKMNRFQGVLPFLFDRRLERALFMCLGSGITAGTLALSPLEQIDAVEISEDVIDASRFFEADNYGVRENSRVNFIVDDGRNFLLTTPNQYDLITFEPMPLALAGISTFYTREYYELCREHLRPGGLVSQWVPLHNGLGIDVIRSLMGTFLSVFPETSVWFINADLFLIGSNEALQLDYELAEQRLAGNDALRKGLDEVYLRDVPELMACFFMGKEHLEHFTRGAPVMTDDRPWAEFVAPKVIHRRNVPELLEALTPYFESPISILKRGSGPGWDEIEERVARRHRAHRQDFEGLKLYYSATFGSTPEVEFRKSLEIDPDDYNAQYYLAEILLDQGRLAIRWDEAEKAVDRLLEAQRHAPHRLDILLSLADAQFEADQPGPAAESYRRYLDSGGTKARARDRAAQTP